MRRSPLVLLVLLLSAAIAASPYLIDRFVRDQGAERAASPTSEGIHHARGFVDGDYLPTSAPVPWDFQADRTTRPYSLLVELLRFEDLQPVEVELDQVEILGARQVRKLSGGRFLAEDIDVAISGVRVSEKGRNPTVAAPGSLPGLIAIRNGIALARDSITTVAVIVIRPEDLEQRVDVQGRVVDRFSQEPLMDAILSTPSGVSASSDENGQFAFEEKLSVSELLGLAAGKEGYNPFFASMGCLSKAWIQHWHEQGEMLFTLKPSKEHRTYRPLQEADE